MSNDFFICLGKFLRAVAVTSLKPIITYKINNDFPKDIYVMWDSKWSYLLTNKV